MWIPVEDINDMYGTTENGKKLGKLYNFTSATVHKPYNWEETEEKMQWTLINGSDSYREPDVLTDESDGDWSEDGLGVLKTEVGINKENNEIKKQWTKQLQDEFDKMITSVESAKGFYIGRYEMSLRIVYGEKIAQSKKEVTPATAASNSANTWYGLYQKAKEYAEKNKLTDVVESSMIWGSQYDQMMIWMQNHTNEKGEKDINIIDSTPIEGVSYNKGNNGSSVGTTGTVETDKLLNVYDLLGNGYEWTLETTNNYCRVSRRRQLQR